MFCFSLKLASKILHMDVVTLPVRSQPPTKLRAEGDELIIISFVDYYLNLLVKHSPAEAIAEYTDAKNVSFQVRSLPNKSVVLSESIPAGLFRPMLARIAFGYMNCSPYGGFRRFQLVFEERIYPVAFYLGNDGLSGFWFKGICGNQV